ncbi:NADP-dependent oxidoreductase [Microbacterium protaetiae]|uniref:NADP-dependent oxidoreductase n=1 Tax=Microbacterium protaetiae TaxID=2509458 RepID=A0A4P6ECR9_9MICO|nr:NADP-dependent oxidoreductase [Microbacterium protaetiae]QAY59436.1 NADP-dependent oxidoreductase [Microbacterium protaetiae]
MTDDTMRAIRQDAFGPSSVLHIAEVAVPVPLPTEVRVRVHAAGVNPVDWKTRAGGGVSGVPRPLPFTVGWDVSGVVDAVGFGVTTLKPGDEVFGMPWFPREAGAYAEYVTAPSRHFARKPRTIGHMDAAALPLASLTAWQAIVDTAGVEAGQRVLIHAAAGGVGHLAVQIAVARGAHVIGTASGAREEFVRGLGAEEFVDYRSARFDEQLDDVDVVIDLVGDVAQTGVPSIGILTPGGLYIGVPGGISPEVAAAAEARGVRTTGILVEPDHTALAAIAELVDAGRLRVAVEQTFPLEQAGAAHDAVATGHTQGKIVLEVAR